MRIYLIAIQAGILTLFAVIGAYGESDRHHSCPLPTVEIRGTCQD